MVRRLLLTLWYALATVVISVALLLSAARLVLPLMDDYRLQAQDWLATHSGQDIRIGQLDLAWRGLGPEVRLLDVALMQPDGTTPLLEVEALGLGFNLLRYLESGELTTRWIRLEGARLELVEHSPGNWALAGQPPSAQPNTLALLLAQPRLELEQVSVTLHPHAVDLAFDLQELSLLLRNRGDRHVVSLTSQLQAQAATLDLLLDVTGRLEQPDSWTGQGYVAVEGLGLADYQTLSPFKEYQIQGALDAELWLMLNNSKPTRLQTRFMLKDMQLTTVAEADSALLVADRLSSALRWQQARSGWVLEVDDLQLQQQTETSAATQARLTRVTQSDGDTHWQLDLNDFDSRPYLGLIQHLAPAGYQEFMLKAAPSAHFDQAQLALVQHDEQVQLENLTGTFDSLQSTAFADWPGATNLSGLLSLQPEHGEMTFTSTGSTLSLPALFREAFSVTALQGQLGWQRYQDRWRIQSPDLFIATPDLEIQQRLRLDVPHGDASPYLELRGNFRRGQVDQVHRFLPARIMPEKTVTWLDNALLAGTIDEGELLFQGRLDEFPYDAGEGRMEIRAHVSDGVLQYHPDWPRIDNIDARLAFINRDMTITSDAASIYGARLSQVKVQIPNLLRSRLEVSGDVQGDVGAMLRFVQDSPLADRGYSVAQLSGTGQADLKLDMSIRVSSRDNEETRLNGLVEFNGNSLALQEWDIRLQDLRGQLAFSEAGLRAERILMQLWGSPAELAIAPAPGSVGSQISVQGSLPLLEQLPQQSVLKQYLSGRANWSATLGLEKNRTGVDLVLHSDMKGIAVTLPQPLGKPPSLQRQLRLHTRLGNGDKPRVLLSYGDHSAAVQLDKLNGHYAIDEAVLLFNQGPATLSRVKGVHIGGRLNTLDITEWQQLREQQNGAVSAPQISSVDLYADRLVYSGRSFDAVGIKAYQDDAGWNLQLNGTGLKGEVFVPDNQTMLPVEITFEELHLPLLPEKEKNGLEPQDIPTLKFIAQDFRYGSYDLGRVELISRRTPEGMQVEQLEVAADWIELNATGSWTRQAGRESSRFKINLTGGDLGKMLATFGYAGNIEGGETRGTLDANWIGGPDDFALHKLEGELDLSIGAGQLQQIEPGAGRVFGLLNLQSLPRRLSLDFSDLFKKGFAFDRIDGSFTLIDSDAYTNNLTIEGPSARIEISGRTGLAARDYDQLVTVVPEVTSGIPVAGALAGGPAVGAALFLADRLFGKEFEKLSRYQYSVTGPWHAPVFTRLSEQDNNAPAAAGN